MRMVTSKQLRGEHRDEMAKLFQVLAGKYGVPAVRVGTQLQNLMGITKMLLLEVPEATRVGREAITREIVEDAVKTMASMAGANMKDVLAVTDALFDFAAMVEGDDPEALAAFTEGAASAIDKARA